MPDRDVPLHRVRGLVSGANWRATKFAVNVPSQLTCGLCGVISHTTFLLPCLHTLCESCVSQSGNDANAVCPFDEQVFTVGDCSKFPVPPDIADKLKACCWNESHGCAFVGTLKAVLEHYEHHCAFHMVSCPRCRGPVLHHQLPRHYRAGCHDEDVVNAPEQRTLQRGLMLSTDYIATSLDELKALVRDPDQDRFPALQSKLNELLEEARNIGAQVGAVTRAFTESEQRLAQALGEHCRAFGFNLQSLEAELRDNQRGAIAMALNESGRRINDQLAQSGREFTTIFCQELGSQLREISAHLTNVFQVWRNDAGEAQTTGGREISWKLEKKHILRKLELVAMESHAYLEYLRHRADDQQKQPAVEVEPLFPGLGDGIRVGMSPFISNVERVAKGYVATLTNIDNLMESKHLVGLFTRWYCRDKYLQVAADGIDPAFLTFHLKWGGTAQGSRSASGEALVYLRHPNYPETKDHYFCNSLSHVNRAAVFGFQDHFLVYRPDLHRLGLVKGASLTLVVSFEK